MKDKKAKTVLHSFIEIVSESNRKPNKLISYRLMKEENVTIDLCKNGSNHDILMYFTHNKFKSIVAERFVRTLKSTIYKKLTANYSKFYLV